MLKLQPESDKNMKILLKELKEGKQEYKTTFGFESIENNGDVLKFISPIEFSGTLKKGEVFVEIEGKVEGQYLTSCHSCGEDAEGKVSFNIYETYRREPGEDEYQLIGNEVEFDEMILENIRLNLPVKYLCKDDCRGICTICRKNLNKEKCDCKKDDEELSPFSELKKLLE